MAKKKKGGKEREKSLNIGLESLTDRDGQKGTKHLSRARNNGSVPAGVLCHLQRFSSPRLERGRVLIFHFFLLSRLSSLSYERYFCMSFFFSSFLLLRFLFSSSLAIKSSVLVPPSSNFLSSGPERP